MTKFILHGGFTRKENKLNQSFFEEFLKGVPSQGTVLLVYFASRDTPETELFSEQVVKFKDLETGKALQYELATKNNFIDQLKRADAIYIGGGDTEKLLRTLRAYPNLKPLFAGKTVAGSSAGAYALGAYGSSHSGKVMREGLGILPLRVVCHHQSNELPPSESSVQELLKTAPETELVYLGDCEWRTFEYE